MKAGDSESKLVETADVLIAWAEQPIIATDDEILPRSYQGAVTFWLATSAPLSLLLLHLCF